MKQASEHVLGLPLSPQPENSPPSPRLPSTCSSRKAARPPKKEAFALPPPNSTETRRCTDSNRSAGPAASASSLSGLLPPPPPFYQQKPSLPWGQAQGQGFHGDAPSLAQAAEDPAPEQPPISPPPTRAPAAHSEKRAGGSGRRFEDFHQVQGPLRDEETKAVRGTVTRAARSSLGGLGRGEPGPHVRRPWWRGHLGPL